MWTMLSGYAWAARLFICLMLCIFVKQSYSMCHHKCVCTSGSRMTCHNVTVDAILIPKHVDTVYLVDFNTDSLTEGVFQRNVNWSRIDRLDIRGSYGVSLTGNVFLGLNNLSELGYHNEQMRFLSADAFNGLDNLLTLDFTDNRRINSSAVTSSLSTASLLNLQNINLTGMGSYYMVTIPMKDEFFAALTKNGQRKLKMLDASMITIADVDLACLYTYGLCDSLERLVVRDGAIMAASGYLQSKKCRSLRVLDLHGTFFAITTQPVTPQSTDFYCQALALYYAIEEVYLDDVFKAKLAPAMVLSNYTFDMYCPMELRKLSMSNNTLKWLNVTAKLGEHMATRFEWLDVSRNIVEYVNPGFLEPSVNIAYMNLSWNSLHVMQTEYPEQFEVLVKSQAKMETFSIAHNSLTDIPAHMFQDNINLKHLDVSGNMLTNVGFKLDHLTHLRLLLLNENLIKVLDSGARTMLDRLAQRTAKGFKINLGDNPFDCSCDDIAIQTIRWLKAMSERGILYVRDSRYTCTHNGKPLNLLGDAGEVIHDYCQWQITKMYLYIGLPTSFVLATLTICTVVLLVRRFKKAKKRYKRLHLTMSQVQTKRFPMPYFAFLSHCTEDDALALDTIMPNLSTRLAALLGTSNQLVYRGDEIFRPGYPIGSEIIRCIEESAISILLVSRRFCQKEWCKQEVREACDQNKPIIIIMIEKVELVYMDKVLKKIFNKYTHATWVPDANGGHLEPDWNILCRAVVDLAGEYVDNQSSRNLTV